jgi:OOP family OmpA-OmpF porin
MSAHAASRSSRSDTLAPAAIIWWGVGAFVFLCALCVQQHLRPIFERKVTAEQAQRWRNAPGLTMSFTYGSARLSGSIPTQAARERLLARAREVLGAAEVVDALRLDEHAVPDDWLDGAVSLLWLAGKKIDNGKIELNGARILVSGTLTDTADKNTLIDNMQAVISEHANLDAQIAAAPKHASLSAALARLAPPGALRFAAQSAVLPPATKQTLNRVAPLLRRSTARVDIIAYADAVGAPDMSQRLSALRAQAVRDYLIERGVPAQQLRFIGAGEAPALANSASSRRAELRVREAQ